ncbi:MAG: ThuA domain-containing protein [Verrucomicrobiota bacterium]
MNRRDLLRTGCAAALGLGLSPWTWAAPAKGPKRRILFFSKSSGFEHSVIKRVAGKPSFAEQVLAEIGPKYNFEFEFSKDGSLFTKDYLAKFDAYFFYTTLDLTTVGTDKNPAMSREGKAAFLDAIKNGKGFIGSHSASDTFHTEPDPADKSARYQHNGDKSDPYILMLGGEFIKHGPQQVATMRVVDKKFPGCEKLEDKFALNEEWYSLKEFQKNLHVLMVQETEGMKGEEYQRGPYPATWARMHGKGRVFYTSMGHREDVWTNPLFQDVLMGGISWAVRNVDADVTPNLEKATPRHHELPPPTPAKPAKAAKAKS